MYNLKIHIIIRNNIDARYYRCIIDFLQRFLLLNEQASLACPSIVTP